MGKFTLAIFCNHLPRVYNTMNGKQKKCYKGSQGDEGSLLKVRSHGPQGDLTQRLPFVSAILVKGSLAGQLLTLVWLSAKG